MQALLNRLPVSMRQMAFYGMAMVLAKAISFAMVPVFTHYLSPADYGRLDVLQTLADLLSLLIGLGMADTLFRFAGSAESTEERNRAAANVFGISLISGAVFLLVTQAAAPLIAASLPGDISILNTRLILGSLAFSAVILVPLSWFRLNGKANWYFVGSTGRALFQAGLVAVFLSFGLGLTGVLTAGLIACVSLAFFLCVAQWRDTGARICLPDIRQYLGYGGPLILVGCAGFALRSIDRWFLAAHIGPAALAEYALAAKFGLITAMLMQPFEMWWTSTRFRLLSGVNGVVQVARRAENGISIALIAAVCVAGAGPLIVSQITPAEYHGAARYIPWLSLLAAVNGITALLNLGIYTGKTTARPLVIDASAAALGVAGFATCIPLFGIAGAIVAMGAALSFRLITTYIVAQRNNHIPYSGFRLTVLGALATASVTALSSMSLTYSEQALAGIVLAICLSAASMMLNLLPPIYRLITGVRVSDSAHSL